MAAQTQPWKEFYPSANSSHDSAIDQTGVNGGATDQARFKPAASVRLLGEKEDIHCFKDKGCMDTIKPEGASDSV